MYPEFKFLGKTIGTYPIFALIGMFAAGYFLCRMAKRREIDVNDMIVLLLIAGTGVFAGGHLLYGATNARIIPLVIKNFDKIKSLKDLALIFYYVFGGSVFYGGLLGGIAAGVIYIRKKRMPLPEVADLFAPAVPLFHAFGRIGCFFGGCCYGIESSFGFVYTRALTPEANFVRRFPVQLAESVMNLLLFGLLLFLLYRGALKGRLFLLYLMLYSVGRFFLEFLRGDAIRGFYLGLSVSQHIGILVFAVSGVGLVVAAFKRRKRGC